MKARLTVSILLLSLILVGAISCNPFGKSKTELSEQLVEVVRGDLTVTVTGSGNIELSKELKLSFGVGGRVDKIYVDEGDEVSDGDVLAKLETDSLELALAEARVASSKAQLALAQAEVTVTEAEVAVSQAQAALQNAEWTLEQTQDQYYLSDIRIAQSDVDAAERNLEESLWKLDQYPEESEGRVLFGKSVVYAQARYRAAKDKLDAMLTGSDVKEVAIKKQQVLVSQQSLELSQQSLKLAGKSQTLALQSMALGEQSVDLARKQLDEATITAPFDGVVAKVSVDEGDVIPSPNIGATVIIHLVDLKTMELNVQVDEIDIIEVKPGQKAIIETDAMPDFPLDGEVAFISLLPTELSGVIVYDAKINFNIPEGSGLRAGMSATVDIIIAQRNNVLLVPDRAIRQDNQGNPVVEVVVNGEVEERTVVTGISDGYQTEIVDGLEEGEMVIGKRAKT